jgi:hypothetical protein
MADDLAEVLRLLHDSERRWRTLRAEGDQWTDAEPSREAFLRSVRPGGIASFRGTPGPPDMDPTWKVWMAPPRFRADVGGPHQSRMLIIGDGHRVCASHPAVAHLRVTDQRADDQPHIGPAGELLRPAGLPAVLRLEVAGRRTFLGRDVWVVRGRPRPEAEHHGPRMFFAADEVEFGVDAERGVLLWKQQRLRDAPFRRVAMTSVAFDEELDPALFEFPDAPQVLESSLPVPGEPRRPPAAHGRQGPPYNVLGEPVAGQTVVARGDGFVIAVDRIVAYPSGFEMGLTVRTRDEPVFGSFDELHRRTWSGSAAFPGESLRIAVVFADGRRSVVENFPPRPASSGDVRLVPMGGGGSQSRFDQRFWVEPLPPPGPLGVIVEWERRGLPETRADLDAGAILAAASRAETLWS